MTRASAIVRDEPAFQSPALTAALAEELRLAARHLNDLAYELAMDPEVVRKHMEPLQKIDLVTQIQLSVASVLESDLQAGDSLEVGLEDMAQRLRAACQRDDQ